MISTLLKRLEQSIKPSKTNAQPSVLPSGVPSSQPTQIRKSCIASSWAVCSSSGRMALELMPSTTTALRSLRVSEFKELIPPYSLRACSVW